MNSVEGKIKSIIEEMGISYLFEDWSRANLKLDKIACLKEGRFPCCINLLPVSGTFTFRSGLVKDGPNCLIAFADKAEFDFNGDDNQTVVERMKKLAMMFIGRCEESGFFEPIEGDIYYSVFYDKLDVNITGIVVEAKLKEAVGVCPETYGYGQ